MATCQTGPGWPGEVLGPKMGPDKNIVLWMNGFENGDYGISRDPNGFYGTQEAFGKASFPQTPFLKDGFPDFSRFSGDWGRVPLAPLCISYGPFEGLAILSTYLVDPLLLYLYLLPICDKPGVPQHAPIPVLEKTQKVPPKPRRFPWQPRPTNLGLTY